VLSAPSAERRVVPPTPVTNGWDAGSSTTRLVSVGCTDLQSLDPESPDAA
jgi:hypothetical protein